MLRSLFGRRGGGEASLGGWFASPAPAPPPAPAPGPGPASGGPGGANRFTLAYLQHLHGVLLARERLMQTVAASQHPLPPPTLAASDAAVIDALKEMAEIMVYGDRTQSDRFLEFFAEKGVMRSLVNLYRGVVPAPATHTIGVAPAVAQLAATGVAAVVTGGSQVSVPPASAGNAGVSSGASSRRSSVVGGGGGGGGGAGGDDDGEGATPAAAAPATVTGVGVAAAAAATAAAAAPAPPPSSSSSSSPPPPSLWYVGPTSSPVRTQVIQTVSILLMNINNTRSLFYLLSNGHITDLIAAHQESVRSVGPLPRLGSAVSAVPTAAAAPAGAPASPSAGVTQEAEEVEAFYVALLKTLSLSINPGTVHFFVTQRVLPEEAGSESAAAAPPLVLRSLPLYAEALRLFNHKDAMVRAAARTIALNVFGVIDPDVRTLLVAHPAPGVATAGQWRQAVAAGSGSRSPLLYHFPTLLLDQIEELVRGLDTDVKAMAAAVGAAIPPLSPAAATSAPSGDVCLPLVLTELQRDSPPAGHGFTAGGSSGVAGPAASASLSAALSPASVGAAAAQRSLRALKSDAGQHVSDLIDALFFVQDVFNVAEREATGKRARAATDAAGLSSRRGSVSKLRVFGPDGARIDAPAPSSPCGEGAAATLAEAAAAAASTSFQPLCDAVMQQLVARFVAPLLVAPIASAAARGAPGGEALPPPAIDAGVACSVLSLLLRGVTHKAFLDRVLTLLLAPLSDCAGLTPEVAEGAGAAVAALQAGLAALVPGLGVAAEVAAVSTEAAVASVPENNETVDAAVEAPEPEPVAAAAAKSSGGKKKKGKKGGAAPAAPAAPAPAPAAAPAPEEAVPAPAPTPAAPAPANLFSALLVLSISPDDRIAASALLAVTSVVAAWRGAGLSRSPHGCGVGPSLPQLLVDTGAVTGAPSAPAVHAWYAGWTGQLLTAASVSALAGTGVFQGSGLLLRSPRPLNQRLAVRVAGEITLAVLALHKQHGLVAPSASPSPAAALAGLRRALGGMLTNVSAVPLMPGYWHLLEVAAEAEMRTSVVVPELVAVHREGAVLGATLAAAAAPATASTPLPPPAVAAAMQSLAQPDTQRMRRRAARFLDGLDGLEDRVGACVPVPVVPPLPAAGASAPAKGTAPVPGASPQASIQATVPGGHLDMGNLMYTAPVGYAWAAPSQHAADAAFAAGATGGAAFFYRRPCPVPSATAMTQEEELVATTGLSKSAGEEELAGGDGGEDAAAFSASPSLRWWARLPEQAGWYVPTPVPATLSAASPHPLLTATAPAACGSLPAAVDHLVRHWRAWDAVEAHAAAVLGPAAGSGPSSGILPPGWFRPVPVYPFALPAAAASTGSPRTRCLFHLAAALVRAATLEAGLTSPDWVGPLLLLAEPLPLPHREALAHAAAAQAKKQEDVTNPFTGGTPTPPLPVAPEAAPTPPLPYASTLPRALDAYGADWQAVCRPASSSSSASPSHKWVLEAASLATMSSDAAAYQITTDTLTPCPALLRTIAPPLDAIQPDNVFTCRLPHAPVTVFPTALDLRPEPSALAAVCRPGPAAAVTQKVAVDTAAALEALDAGVTLGLAWWHPDAVAEAPGFGGVATALRLPLYEPPSPAPAPAPVPMSIVEAVEAEESEAPAAVASAVEQPEAAAVAEPEASDAAARADSAPRTPPRAARPVESESAAEGDEGDGKPLTISVEGGAGDSSAAAEDGVACCADAPETPCPLSPRSAKAGRGSASSTGGGRGSRLESMDGGLPFFPPTTGGGLATAEAAPVAAPAAAPEAAPPAAPAPSAAALPAQPPAIPPRSSSTAHELLNTSISSVSSVSAPLRAPILDPTHTLASTFALATDRVAVVGQSFLVVGAVMPSQFQQVSLIPGLAGIGPTVAAPVAAPAGTPPRLRAQIVAPLTHTFVHRVLPAFPCLLEVRVLTREAPLPAELAAPMPCTQPYATGDTPLASLVVPASPRMYACTFRFESAEEAARIAELLRVAKRRILEERGAALAALCGGACA